MSAKINLSELKLATKVATQVRDLAAGKKQLWAGLYRLVAANGELKLYANDGSTWITWNLKLEESTKDEYDIVLSASRLNEMAARIGDGESYEILYEDNQFGLIRGTRQLWIPVEAHMEYTQPKTPQGMMEFQEQLFSVESAVLEKNLKFAAPFLDANNPTAARMVGTWTTEGTVIGGSLRQAVKIEGMPCPPMDMSFKQKPMRSVVAFLGQLAGDVHITLTGNRYIFACPTSGHILDISAESVHFSRSFFDLGSQVPEVIKFDGKSLLEGVESVSTTLPAEADKLLVTIRGMQEQSVVELSTMGDRSRKKSCDSFPAIREGETGDRDIQFSVNCRVFEATLGGMSGAILEGRCYMEEGKKRFGIEDERSADTDTYRSVIIPVDAHLDEEEETDEDEVSEKKKSPRKSTLTKS